MMTVIPPVEEGTFSFDEQGTITIDAGTLLPSVRYSLMMTLSHKEEIEQDLSSDEIRQARRIFAGWQIE